MQSLTEVNVGKSHFLFQQIQEVILNSPIICSNISNNNAQLMSMTLAETCGGIGYLSDIVALNLDWICHDKHNTLPKSIIIKV